MICPAMKPKITTAESSGLKRTYQFRPFYTHCRNAFYDTAEPYYLPAFIERDFRLLPWYHIIICFSVTDLAGLILTSNVLETLEDNDQAYHYSIRYYHLIIQFYKKCLNTLGSNSYFGSLLFVLGVFFPLLMDKLFVNTAGKHEMRALFYLKILKQVSASSVG